ncbi:unnamed protein product [Urochloa decumbens]|uniref:Ubiquitin-like protease family profile domain-containing protein n=1 Tax=Urochloa decumbens TaxID=240449 RepID=A0ABC9BCN8_9POAL
MARKRRRDLEDWTDSDDDAFVDSVNDSISDTDDVHIVCSQDRSADEALGTQDSSSDSDSEFNFKLYQDVLKDYNKVKAYKNKLKKRFIEQSGKAKSVQKSKDAFTRFSVKAFSDVLDALTPHHRTVIDKYGFGSLLLFDKCYVPNKFAKWVAQLVDCNSGDIVLDGKIISLTKESVNHILGIPIGGTPFPSDASSGKSVILHKFQKMSIPPVKFFANKLIKNDALCDQDIFICFIVVALHSFLCPNASLVPSYRYFGIFDDLENARNLDWSGYVLSWLIEHIKQYKKKKAKSMRNAEGSLGGCIYYLAVLYLDFVDFGPRRVSDAIPRISVWKGNMIRTYSNFDLKSPGLYGFRPIMDFADTCYYKSIDVLRRVASSVSFDSGFVEDIESVSRCKLPSALKQSICKAVESHCFHSGLMVNLDVASVSTLPPNLLNTFTKLMQHASSVDQRSKKLVLDVLKLITEFPHDDCDIADEPPLDASPNKSPVKTATNSLPAHSSDEMRTPGLQSSGHSSEHIDLTQASPKVLQSTMKKNSVGSTKSFGQPPKPANNYTSHRSSDPSTSNTPAGEINVDNLVQKLHNNSVVTPKPSTKVQQFVSPASGYSKPSSQRPLLLKHKPRLIGSKKVDIESKIASLRDPLCDISNVDVVSTQSKLKRSINSATADLKDVIPLDDDEGFVPDSISPSPRPRIQMNLSVKDTPDSDDDSSFLTQRENIPKVTPNLSKRHSVLSLKRNVRSSSLPNSHKSTHSPEIQVTGVKSLSQSVREMTKKSDDMYNKKFLSSIIPAKTPHDSDFPDMYASGSGTANFPPYLSRDSSTVVDISVSRSDLKHYKAICSLSSSQYSNEDAVCFGKVRCTFWSLGESMKPGGYVNPFVMSAFCYSLYIKPSGQLDLSKAHYFFANIGENIMKDPDEANLDVLIRAFKRSSKARPLNHCNNLYFPTNYNNHWFVFVVNIKDHNFVFLDPLHHKDHEYIDYVTEKMVNNFQLYWDRYVKIDMKFDDYRYLYPDLPEQPLDNSFDSGIYAMMSLQHWTSPRSVLCTMFDSHDISRIRVKIANELVFLPANEGRKDRVLDYEH